MPRWIAPASWKLPAASKRVASVPVTVRPSTPVTSAVPVTLPLFSPWGPIRMLPEPFFRATAAPPASSEACALLALMTQLRLPSDAWLSTMSKAPPSAAGPKYSVPSSVMWNTGPPSASATALVAFSAIAVLRLLEAPFQSITGPLVPSTSPLTPSWRLTARLALVMSACASVCSVAPPMAALLVSQRRLPLRSVDRTTAMSVCVRLAPMLALPSAAATPAPPKIN